MDILVVSNIFNKFSKLLLNKEKTNIDIQILTEFLEDPFNLDLSHLNYFYLNLDGTTAVNTAQNAINIDIDKCVKNEESQKGGGDEKKEENKGGEGDDGDDGEDGEDGDGEGGDEEGEGGEGEGEEGEGGEGEGEEGEGKPSKTKAYLKSLSSQVNEQTSGEGSTIMKSFDFLLKCILYPLIFIFLMIFPYIYVTYSSFRKLLKSYRKNVLTV